MEWSEGRKLTKLTYHPTYSSTNRVTTYQYDHNGTLIKRTDSSGSYVVYHLIDGKAIGETRYNANHTVSLYMRYNFDESGSVVGISLWYPGDGGWTDFYFAKNLQGDVVAVYRESDKALVASYSYDSWGNILAKSGDLADINPFRYRTYYFDTESWFYYLQSRFYDPAIGRFINADDVVLLGANGDFTSQNLFVYCGNNPVIREDNNGNFWLFTAAVKVGIGLATQYAGDVLKNIASGKTGVAIFERTSSNGEYLAAGITALIPGTGLDGALVRNIVTEGISVIEDIISGNEVNVIDSMINVGLGTVLDAGVEKVSDKAADFISSKMPQNYSSYAHTARQSDPNLTREQIYRSMQRSIRFNRVASKAVSIGFDFVRSTLPY